MTDRTQDDPPDARPTDYFVVLPWPVIAMGSHHTQVYAVLRKRADNDNGTCWPSHRRIADDAGLSVRRVQQVLGDLKAAGWIDWQQRKSDGKDAPNTSNIYRVFGTAGRQDVQTGAHEVPTGAQDVPTPRAQDVQTGAHEVPSELRTNELEPKSQKPMVTADAATETPFDVFWRVYPRKVGKQAARKAWARAIKRERFHIIIARCKQMADDPNLPTDRRLIPHPTTWLNRDGWDDEPYPPNHDGRGPSGSRMFADTAALLAMPGLEIAQ